MSTPTVAETKLVESIRRRLDRNAHGHISQALRLKFANDVATFITTVGGASIMGMSAFLLGSPDAHVGTEVAVALTSGLITLVGVWQAVWQLGERSRRHKEWSNRFALLEDECRLFETGLSHCTVDELGTRAMAASAEADLVPERHWRKNRRPPPGAD